MAAPIPIRPKISSDYLEKLRIRFLDTRSNEQLETPVSVAQLASGDAVTQTNENVPAPTGFQDLTLTDFEQLIYANALAKRPIEAEQAFNLMEVKYFFLFFLFFLLTPYFRNIMSHQALDLSII